MDRLATYQARRDFTQTAQPKGVATARPRWVASGLSVADIAAGKGGALTPFMAQGGSALAETCDPERTQVRAGRRLGA